MSDETGYRYLNSDNLWRDVELHNLAFDADGTLSLIKDSADSFAASGSLRAGPFSSPSDVITWFRLWADADDVPPGTRLQFFTLTSDDKNMAFPPPAEMVFAEPWQALPPNRLDGLIRDPRRHLWVAAVLSSDGEASPRLRQLRIEYGRDTYLDLLPAIYSQGAASRDFLQRFLALPQSVLGGLEDTIDDLPQLFDPFATPADRFPSWLAWLSGWLDFDLNESWSQEQTRANLAQAFELYSQRGTLEGLRRYLKLYAGVEAHITEPGLQANLWSLGETSSLGFSTMLAPAHLQGAVPGSSATFDQAHLSRGDRPGATLFEDLAHRFCVQVYRAELNRPGALADVRAVLDREKPAHTSYHLCVIEARMRVGIQARVGIDAIVAQGPPAAQFGMLLGDSVLTDAPPGPS